MTTNDALYLGWVLFGLLIYFLPFLIALERKHNNRKAILVLTLFAGWTFVGWVVAITWAYSTNVEEQEPELEPAVESIGDNVTRMYWEDR